MSVPSDTWPERGPGVERIMWLADAIFAFSITLLAIDIRVPDIAPGDAATELPLAMTLLGPRIISFLITFWIVASYWIAFHRLFSYVVQYDRGLIRACLLFLMFIVLLPFPADLVGRYPSQPLSLITAALFFAATGVALDLIWVHASRRHRLVEKELSARLIRGLTLQYLVSPLVFIFSIPAFFFVFTYSPSAMPFVLILWFLILPLHSEIDRKYRQ